MTTDELLLMAYVDGALNKDARRMLERRLASDAALRQQLAGLQRTTQLTRLALESCDAAVPSAKSKVVLLAQAAPQPAWGARPPVAAIISAALAMAAGALLVWTLVSTELRHAAIDNGMNTLQFAETAVLKGGRMS